MTWLLKQIEKYFREQQAFNSLSNQTAVFLSKWKYIELIQLMNIKKTLKKKQFKKNLIGTTMFPISKAHASRLLAQMDRS